MNVPVHTADLDTLRNKIARLVERIEDAPTLLYCICIVNKIANREAPPSRPECQRLKKAFLHMAQAAEIGGGMSLEEMSLIDRHTNVAWLNAPRCMAATVRHFRQTKGLSRQQLGRASGIPARWLLALERAQVPEVSLEELGRLASALGTTPVAIMTELKRRLELSMRWA